MAKFPIAPLRHSKSTPKAQDAFYFLRDYIKFQEQEHERFNDYMKTMILREMFHHGQAKYTGSGVQIAAGATTKVPVSCTLQMTNDYNPDYYQTAWLQAFNCDVGGVARITLNKFEHNETNHTLLVEGGVFVFNPKTSAITVTNATVDFIIGKDLQKAYSTFEWNKFRE